MFCDQFVDNKNIYLQHPTSTSWQTLFATNYFAVFIGEETKMTVDIASINAI